MATVNLGKVAITPKGTWNDSTLYRRLDFVYYDGNGYVCIKDLTSSTISPTNTEYWMLAVSKGDKGGLTDEAIAQLEEMQSQINSNSSDNRQLFSRVSTLEENVHSFDGETFIQGTNDGCLVLQNSEDNLTLLYTRVEKDSNKTLTHSTTGLKFPLATEDNAGIISADDFKNIDSINEFKELSKYIGENFDVEIDWLKNQWVQGTKEPTFESNANFDCAIIDVSEYVLGCELEICSATYIGTTNKAKNHILDKHNNIIDSWYQEQGEIINKTLPANAKYLRLNNIHSIIEPYVKVNKNNIEIINSTLDKHYNLIENISNVLFTEIEITDIQWKYNYFYWLSGGSEPNQNYDCAIIDISDFTDYELEIMCPDYVTAPNNAYNAFLDNSNSVIDSWRQEVDEVVYKTIPTNAKYLRVNYHHGNDYYFKVKINNFNEQNKKIEKVSDETDSLNVQMKMLELKVDNMDSNNTGGGSSSDGYVNHWDNKIWYAYGTSLTSVSQGTYASQLATMANLKLTNKGIPGGGIIGNRNIYNSVINTTDGKTEADLITLEVLANDSSATFGTIYDTANTTFLGSLVECIKYLQENTNAQIVIISSMSPRYAVGNSSDLISPSDRRFNNKTWYEMCQDMKTVAEMYGCYYIDPNNALGYFRKQQGKIYLADQIHHTQLGGYVYASYIWSKLKDIPLFK